MSNNKSFYTAALEALKDNTQQREFGPILGRAQASTNQHGMDIGILINKGYRGDFKTVDALRTVLEKLGAVTRPAPLPVAKEELVGGFKKEAPIDSYNPASDAPGATTRIVTDESPDLPPSAPPPTLTREEKKQRRWSSE